MGFLREYSFDIFLSYAHGPTGRTHNSNQQLNLLSEWTRRFVEDLTDQLDHNLGRYGNERVKIFWDPDLEGSGSLTGNLKQKVEESALFLAVMSPFYLKSPWCLDEIKWFLSGSTQENPELRRFGRTFVARIEPTDHNSWPDEFKDELGKPMWGHFFHPKADPHESVVPFGWPCPNRDVVNYWSEIVRLGNEITTKLLRLKALENTPAGKAGSVPVEPSVGRRVFLGFAHDTLSSARSELRRCLSDFGIQVLPPENEEPWDEASLRESLDLYLREADVMALCANEYCGTWPRDQNGGFISLQMEMAKERMIPCQLWLSWELDSEPQTPPYKSFLQELIEKSQNSALGIRLRHPNVRAFSQYVKETVNQEKVVASGVEQLAVVCSNLHPDDGIYRRFYNTVRTAISETDRGSLLVTGDATGQIRLKELEKDINRADTIVVICFDQELGWASHVMREIRQLIKADSSTGVRLLVIGPRVSQGVTFDGTPFRFTTLNAYDMDEEHLRQLLKQAIFGTNEAMAPVSVHLPH
jgi:TIR domain-containing protein